MKPLALVPFALLALCAACEGGPPARQATVVKADASRRGTVAIAFEAKKQGAKPFPFPLVDGKVGGQATRFILDTGASVHAIDTTVAAAANITSPGKASLLSIEGWGALPEHAVAVRELPKAIRAHGIGGIIAPQLLSEPGQAVVLDLINQQLRMRPKSTAWSEMDDVGAILTPPGQRKLCPADADGIAGFAVAVDATVEGEATRLAIDTGASRSILLEGSKSGARAAGHPLLGRSVAAGASADVATSLYGAVPFKVGAWSMPLDVGVSTPPRAAQCGAEGWLGMDVLHDCALAMTADEAVVACRAPSR